MSLPRLPDRPTDSHKGDFGRVQIIGGSEGMAGAPVLAALAALRSGAGLVNIACAAEVLEIVAGLVPCATTLELYYYQEFPATVRGTGPGLGEELDPDEIGDLLEDQAVPLVLDADGLNRLAELPKWWEYTHSQVVLTPHTGEMKRLCDSAKLHYTAKNRIRWGEDVARLSHAVVVLKGAGTVVSDGRQTYVNTTGNPGMATGGSGDVLTGVIAALLGQGLSPYDAACLGVYLHGLAGDLAARQFGQVSLIAADLIDFLPTAFQQYQSQ